MTSVLLNWSKVVVEVVLWRRKSEHDKNCNVKYITVRVWFQWAFLRVLCAYGCFNATHLLSTTYPPTADDDGQGIYAVPDDEQCGLESAYHAISENK